MAFPFLLAGGVAGAKAIGDLLSSGDEGIPSWLIDELRGMAGERNYNGFLPDKSAWDADLKAKLADVYATLPVGVENFNADLASRGIFRSGEAPKNLYGQIYAPIARTAASAVASSNLGYSQQYQQGMQFGANLRQNYYNMLLQAVMQRQPSAAGTLGGSLSDLASAGLTLGGAYYLGKQK